ncbi:MAG: CZB domain-containing protein [Nitrospirae bacterium]|nr:CZB domain-containing protein [Nitrospirota bacterium]
MKIGTSINLVVAAVVAFALLSGFLIHNELSGMMDDGKVINNTGKVRGSSQRFVKLELSKNYKDADKIAGNIDKLINGLINGDDTLGMKKADNEVFLSQMNKVESVWKQLRQHALDSRKDPLILDQVLRESEEFFELTNEATKTYETISRHHITGISTSQMAFSALNIIILVAISLMARKKILHPLKFLREQVENMVGKNLRISVTYNSKDEVGHLVNEINELIDFFNEVINSTIVSINNVVTIMDVVRTGTDVTADGAKEQLSQSIQIATAAEEMSQTISDIAKNAAQAKETSTNAMTIAEKGKDIALGAVTTMNSVNLTTSELSSLIANLNGRVNEIGNILLVINDIADQTNLLALNAAIEAARAGEQGRGFAVVADEVRKLAERTKTATTEISAKITAVQSQSERTTSSMEMTFVEVNKTTELMNQVGNVLHEIVNANHDVRDQISRIATAVDEQSATAEDVVKSVETMSNISQTMESGTVEIMKEITKMITSAEVLRKAITGFITRGGELLILDLAKTDHRLWVNRISFCIKGHERIDPNTLADHTTCRLGKWYYAEGRDFCGHMHSFQKMEQPHKRLHALGKEIVSIYNTGNVLRAKELYRELEALSDEIIGALNETKNRFTIDDNRAPHKEIHEITHAL